MSESTMRERAVIESVAELIDAEAKARMQSDASLSARIDALEAAVATLVAREER